MRQIETGNSYVLRTREDMIWRCIYGILHFPVSICLAVVNLNSIKCIHRSRKRPAHV